MDGRVSSRSQRSERVRAAILHAAAQAIAEHGYFGMSMRQLARETGRGLSSFYNYFPSKEDLLFELQFEAFRTLNGAAESAISKVDEPGERLYIFVLNHLCYFNENAAVMRVLVHEAAALPADKRQAIRRLKEEYYRLGASIVRNPSN